MKDVILVIKEKNGDKCKTVHHQNVMLVIAAEKVNLCKVRKWKYQP